MKTREYGRTRAERLNRRWRANDKGINRWHRTSAIFRQPPRWALAS